MNAGRLTIYERFETRSTNGKTFIELNLYPRQAKKLFSEGFTLDKIMVVYGHQAQTRYRISWLNAQRGTLAYDYLMLAAGNNDELCQKLMQSGSVPRQPPCYN